MSAPKPADLINYHEKKEQKRQRKEWESSLTPKKSLTNTSPEDLTGDVSRSVWRETVRQYQKLDAQIVSLLDQGLLLDYCVVSEQLTEIDGLRCSALSNCLKIESALSEIQDGEKNPDLKVLVKLLNELNHYKEDLIKLDARTDNKRKLLHLYRQALMLTPRSRGNVALKEEKRQEPQTEMDKIIDGKR